MASMLRSLMAFSFMAVATQAAAPPLTEIQDILYKANGARFDGIAQIEWKGFQSSTGTEIPQNAIAVRVTRGSLRVALVPTTNALSPASYTVRFNSEGRTQFVEYWAVPPTSAILKLRDVRTPAPAVGNLTTPVVIGNIQEIIGLRNELDLRPARGAGWVPGRAAAIGSSGAIEAVIGNSSDCVKVDGTSGPCGTSGGGGGHRLSTSMARHRPVHLTE